MSRTERNGTAHSVRKSLRDLHLELSLFNRRVGSQLRLNDVDLDALNVIARHGAFTPSTLARRSGFHPATTTGILDRLERGGWIVRERTQTDRRAVLIRVRGDRAQDLNRLLAGMNSCVHEVCDEYQDTELTLINHFLKHTAAACRKASDRLPSR